MMTCLPFHRRGRVLRCFTAICSLALLPSCIQLRGPAQPTGEQSLKIKASETYAISVVCAPKDEWACDTESIQSFLTAGLQERGIRVTSRQNATRTITITCRKISHLRRNEPPLAPGSRLWYQRRIFAPTSSRAPGARPGEGSLQLEIVLRLTQPSDDNVPQKEPKATRVIADPSAAGLRTAIGMLLTATE
jgi:hypothetical protein